MSTQKVIKEFTYDRFTNGTVGLVNRTLDVWPSFLNTYGVWPNYGNAVETHSLTFYWTVSQGGTYTFAGTCDNSFTWSIENARMLSSSVRNTFSGQVLSGKSWQTVFSNVPVLPNFQYNNRYPPIFKLQPIRFAPGQRIKMTVNVRNDGGPAAFGGTITNSSGAVEFHTRQTITDTSTGRYANTFPFDASITAHVWGGGGGGGGNDAFSRGGRGSPGLYNTLSFIVSAGDTLEVAVGVRGAGGLGDLRGGPPGGVGGLGRTDIDSDSTLSLNGGKGGRAGLGGASGAGGGGGGASVVLLNGTPILIAGGGGGGGGAGIFRAADPNASISNNVIGATPSDYRGMNGLDKVGDGGGGGGGGGGYPGGTGGQTNSIFHQTLVRGTVQSSFSIRDLPADPGKTGGNLPANSASTGVDTLYYKSGFAGGGPGGSGNGQDGRIVLEIEPVGIVSTKVSGEWKQVPEIFVKVSGAWKSVSEAQIKVDGSWKKVEDSGRGDIELPTASGNYGTVVRSYSS
jgi:hypothetical protein